MSPAQRQGPDRKKVAERHERVNFDSTESYHYGGSGASPVRRSGVRWDKEDELMSTLLSSGTFTSLSSAKKLMRREKMRRGA